jgi:cytoplasmic iron level regulating protein YaaA (DUF328/UPF0246 family)
LPAVLILLPPSEGKADAGSSRRLDPARLSFPALHPARERVLDTLTELCATDPAAAVTALGLSDGQRDEVARNARLREVRTLPAARLYTGVLYDALGLATLTPGQHAFLKRTTVIFSGLWGAVRLDDRLPPYRCSIGASLPGLGGLAAYWRTVLAEPLNELAGNRVVLDLRSSAYATLWTPTPNTVTVRVLHERDGKRSVVSHFNKATKGRLVRDLAEAGARPRTPKQLVAALRDLKYTVEGSDRRLDLVVTTL